MARLTRKIRATEVADYILVKAKEGERKITNKKLQKLLYYVQAWSLALNDKPAFEEKIEAWVHGPAIRSVYASFREFGFSYITKRVNGKDIIGKLPSDILSVANEVWTVYGKYDAGYLELLTHKEKPWQEAREGLEAHTSSSSEISHDTMRDFYKSKLGK